MYGGHGQALVSGFSVVLSTVSGSARRMSPPSTGASIASGWVLPLSRGQLRLDVGLGAHRVELAGDVVAATGAVTSSSAPEASSSSMAPARACIWAVLSSARWIA